MDKTVHSTVKEYLYEKGDTMKSLPTGEFSYANLYDMAQAPIKSRLLLTGIELGLFDETESVRSAAEIAEALKTDITNTRLFLDALVTIGLLNKKNGLYHNRPETSEFLVKKGTVYLGPLLQLINTMSVNSLNNLTDLVRNGSIEESEASDFSSEKLWAEATRASAGWVEGGVGTQMASIVSSLPEFVKFNRMLDLGGGHGMFALYFVDAHPTMTAAVFDQPSVITVAKDFIYEFDMQERVAVMAGDYLKDDIGTEYDFIWACATLNFARQDLDAMISKIFHALNPGGIFISFQDGMTHEMTQPDTMLGHLGDAMRMGGNFSFKQGEICEAMLRCGFKSVRSHTIMTPMGEMDLDIARK